MAYAVGTLTSDATNVTAADTVTIGSKTYTFESSLTNVDGNVKIGATAALTLANLKAAINLSGTAGTDYATLMTVHPTVRATAVTSTTVVVKSKVDGAVGNHIPTTEASTHLSWGAATLASGTGAPQTTLATIRSGLQLNAAVEQAIIDMTDPDGAS